MKWLSLMILTFCLILAGCGSETLIQDDFNTDIIQVLGILDKAHTENRDLNSDEDELLNKFKNKYLVGRYYTKDKTDYEMNGLEKDLVRNINSLKHFTHSEEHLASEEDLYKKLKNDITKQLEIKEIPEELEGKYPTYEIYSGIHPQVKVDAQKVINAFDKTVNGGSNTFNSTDMYELNSFIKKYDKTDIKIDGKHYLLNDEGFSIFYTFTNLKEDVENGYITSSTITLFNEAKKKIKE